MASSDRCGLTTLMLEKNKQFNHDCCVEWLNLIWSHSSRVPLHMADSTGGHDMPFRDQGTGEAGKGSSPCFSIALYFFKGWGSPTCGGFLFEKAACATGSYLGRSQNCLAENDCPRGHWSYLQTLLGLRGQRFLTFCVNSCSCTYILPLSFSAGWNGC